MDDTTTHVQLDRGTAESMLAAVRERKIICAEFPQMFAPLELLRLSGAEVVLVAALDRIAFQEHKPDNPKRRLRDRIVAGRSRPW